MIEIFWFSIAKMLVFLCQNLNFECPKSENVNQNFNNFFLLTKSMKLTAIRERGDFFWSRSTIAHWLRNYDYCEKNSTLLVHHLGLKLTVYAFLFVVSLFSSHLFGPLYRVFLLSSSFEYTLDLPCVCMISVCVFAWVFNTQRLIVFVKDVVFCLLLCCSFVCSFLLFLSLFGNVAVNILSLFIYYIQVISSIFFDSIHI